MIYFTNTEVVEQYYETTFDENDFEELIEEEGIKFIGIKTTYENLEKIIETQDKNKLLKIKETGAIISIYEYFLRILQCNSYENGCNGEDTISKDTAMFIR